MDHSKLKEELKLAYYLRFNEIAAYRMQVWAILTKHFFQKYIPHDATVLDLGAGYGEFINQIRASKKYAMDLNPETEDKLGKEVEFLHQDCSEPWQVSEESLDVVFTSNFFEHLPNKEALQRTVLEAKKCLKPGGRLIALGPNASCLAGRYWDFWDHHVALTNHSLRELLEISGFQLLEEYDRFLPYTMVRKAPPPLFFVRLYLKVPFAWKFWGKRFLLIAERPA